MKAQTLHIAPHARHKGGFTLIEMLLAISIAGIVMAALSGMLFSMVRIMENFEDENSFEAHTDAVETFLTSAFSASAFADSADASLTGSDVGGEYSSVTLGRPPSSTTMDDLRLCFGVKDDHPMFLGRSGMSTEKVCWVDFQEDKGLFILWCFVVPDEDSAFSDERPVYETQVSDKLKKLTYLYNYDSRGWVEEDRIRDGDESASKLPSFIKLEFEDAGRTIIKIVPVFSIVDKSLYSPAAAASSSSSSSSSDSSSGGGSSNSGSSSTSKSGASK